MTHKEKASAYHAKRLNCCQSVFVAFHDITGLDEQTAMNITAGFGLGMQTGEACGVVVGALLALGGSHTFDSEDAEGENGKAVASALAVAFQERFRKCFKHCRCEDLLKECFIQDGCVRSTAAVGPGGEGYCDILIETAAEIVDDLLAEQRDKGPIQKDGARLNA